MAERTELYNWNKAAAVARSSPLLRSALDKVVHRYAVEAAEIAKPLCPVATGTLQKSLTASVDYEGRRYEAITGKKAENMAYWVGSALPYCAVQEYEHKTKSFFLHKGIAKVQKPMKDEAIKLLDFVLGAAWHKG